MIKMLPDISDTIVARATPPGEGGICVIRLSGDAVFDIVDKIIEGGLDKFIKNPRLMILANLIDEEGRLIDEALVVYFKKPNSYSGDDTFEFHCHGGEYVSHRTIETLVKHGARRAQAGEFTMRAFLHGRIDLTQAEGILSLISSSTAPNHIRAVNLIRGGLKERIERIKKSLMDMISPFEAVIDHPEDDTTSENYVINSEMIERIKRDIQELASSYRETPELEGGFKMAIAGRPNMGKSSLMNLLMMKRRVLVHDSPGTTRDVVSEEIMIGEGRFKIFDTAGLRDDAFDIEAEGIKLAKQIIIEADGCIVMLDISKPLSEDDFEILDAVMAKPLIICCNKIDLENKWSPEDYPDVFRGRKFIMLSCKTEAGMKELLEAMKNLYNENIGNIRSDIPLLKRHFGHLTRASEALSDAQSAIEMMLADDVISIDLRRALEEILNITGEHYDDALLEEIFSRFCIGK